MMLSMNEPFLKVNDVRKQYGHLPALRGVSFSIERGEIFGLLGPNGAGKTTLLSIIAGLAAAGAGTVHLDGHLIHPDNRAIRQLIGLAPQDLSIYEGLTARENLHFFGRLYGLRGKELARRTDAVLEAVALRDRADDRVETYSGGMKRRLNLGVAVLHQPRLLICDEPTVGVDPQSRNHIFEEVRRQSQAGLTIIYTTHYMEEVQSLCQRVAVLDFGKLIACDTLEGLLRHLDGEIVCRTLGLASSLRASLAEVPGVREISGTETDLVIRCADVPAAMVRLVSAASELGVKLTAIETREPNLERVFLHLTGRALRD
jgi:ABC-2 type transport system ATP-binding protein